MKRAFERRAARGRPPELPLGGGDLEEIAGNSLTVAGWTIVSRLTGFGRVALTAAVLGPTYLGNTFQAINLIPMLTFEVLTGSLFISLLVPPLVRSLDRGNNRDAERLAGTFLGLAMLALTAVAAIMVLAGPLLVGLLAVGVEDPGIAIAQRRAGWLLLALLMPQVVLYGVAAVGAAVMNAHGRFALPAAAPALENIGLIATLVATALTFGTGVDVVEVSVWQLSLLGLGSTAAVALHAGAQLWGARRTGLRLRPNLAWRTPEVTQVVRRALPSLGYASLNSLLHFAIIVATNRAPGGVVAFQLALNFFYLPVAIGARPVAAAMLPQLSRLAARQDQQRFREELVRGTSLSLLIVVPAAVSYAVLARPLASAASFGEMDSALGVTLLAASLAALAPGVVGEAGFLLATQASYARDDARSPFRAKLLRTVVGLAGIVLAFAVAEGTSFFVLVGLAFSAGSLLACWQLARRLLSSLPTTPEHVRPSLLRAVAASIVMVGPAYLVAASVQARIPGSAGSVIGMVSAAMVGLVLYLTVQRALRSPELEELQSRFPTRGRG